MREGTTALAAFVFQRGGQPVGDIRKVWAVACQAADIEGTLFHNLRRRVVRSMDRAGVSQTVTMALSGHKTANMTRLYTKTTMQRRREAARLRRDARTKKGHMSE